MTMVLIRKQEGDWEVDMIRKKLKSCGKGREPSNAGSFQNLRGRETDFPRKAPEGTGVSF